MRKQNNSFPDYVLDYHHYFSSVADEGNIHLIVSENQGEDFA